MKMLLIYPCFDYSTDKGNSTLDIHVKGEIENTMSAKRSYYISTIGS